jgi:hypothetical protein
MQHYVNVLVKQPTSNLQPTGELKMSDENTNTRLVKLEVKQEILDSNYRDLRIYIDFAMKDLKADFERTTKTLKSDFDTKFHENKVDVDKKLDDLKDDMRSGFIEQNAKLDNIIKKLSVVDLVKMNESVNDLEHKRFVFTGGYKMVIFLVTAVGSIAVALDWIFAHLTK